MAVDAFLKIEGVPGESTDTKHKGEIEVLSFSWGISNTTTIGSATGGAGAGKASVHDISVTKYIDTASPVLFQKVCEGSVSQTADLTLSDRATGLAFYKLHFEDVFISSVQPGTSPGGNSALETLTFNFGSVEISASDGRGNTNTVTCGANEKVSAPSPQLNHPAAPHDHQRR